MYVCVFGYNQFCRIAAERDSTLVRVTSMYIGMRT